MSNVPTNLIPTRITGLPEYVGSSTLGYIPYVLEGRTYKVQFANIAAVGAVPSTRVIATGNGLEGGGDLSQNRTISIIPHGVGYSQLDFTGVTAGVYGAADTIPSITVDETGRITNIADVPVVLSNYVPSSRTVTAGAGLTGGGQLNNNITIALNPSNATPQSLGVASAGTGTQAARDDHVHPAVDLTDTSETQGVLPLGRGGTGVALSPVVGAVIYADNDSLNQTIAGNAGQVLTSAGGLGAPYWQTITGTGTVTDVSVVTANGFAGTVANPDTTAAITVKTTVTGMVKGDGTAISAAAAGTDYVAPGAITGSGLTMATARLLGRTTAGSGAVEEITVGTGLSLSGGSLVNSAPDQTVTLTGGTAISISGSYPSFTITNTAPDQIVSLTGAGTTVVTGTYPNFTITSNDQYTGTVTSVAASGGTTGLSFTGSPITTSGTLTLGGTLVVANGGTGATTAADARTNLGAAASGANSDITSLSGITGGIATPDYIDFDTTAAPARATGRLWWDNTDSIQTLNLGMAGSNATMQIGEELYFRVKASSAITEGQVVMFTGTVGGSGALTAAPATGLTKDTASYIMGVATEDIALNGWGYVTQFGLVRGIDTTGGAEAWVDGQILYYNPAVAGGLTKNVPSAPNAKVEVAAVVNAASGGSGSLFVRPIARFSLGQLNDVETAAAANLDLLQYNSSGGYWQHVAPSTISVGTATNLAGGAANRIAYQTGSGTTGFITAPSVANTFLEWSGSAFQWSSNPLGTVTSVDVSGGTTGLTTSGGPITTSGTITLAGTLNVANGGTGATSLTSGYLIKGNGTSAVSSSIIYDSGTNVGIGDTAPAYKLTVAGDMRLTGGGDVRLSSATGTTTAGGDSMIYNDANNMIFTTGTTTAERMRITSGGSVGIGTSNPTSLLDVNGNAEVNGTLFLGSSNHGNLASDSNTLYARGTNIAFQDAAGSGTYAYISSSGDLGIGTSSPGGKLDVAGVFKVQGNGDVYGASGNAGAIFLCGGSAYNAGGGVKLYGSSGGDAVAFYTGAFSERMRINSSGNLGVGTSSPSTRFNVKGGTTWLQNFDGSASSPTETVDWPVPALNVTSFGDFTLQTMMTFTLPNDGNYFTGDSVWNFRLDQTASSTTSSGVNGMRFMGPGYLMFGPGATEKARIDSSGNLLVGTTTPLAGNTSSEYKVTTLGLWPLTLNANDRGLLIRNSNGSSGFYAYFEYNGGTNNGSISWVGGTTYFNITSDARIKDNIVDAPETGDLIDGIKVRSWDFKADGAHWRYGMVAQELLEVAPEAVTVPEDPELMMGVDYAKLVPMLIKEVQSLRARVAQLEGN